MKSVLRKSAACVGVLVLLNSSQLVHAQFSLGDAVNYAAMYEGNGGHNFQINSGVNAGNSYSIVGNIGVGNVLGGSLAALQFNSPATINGNINFAGTNTSKFQNSGGIYTGSLNFGVAQVNTDLTYLNNLSATLGAETGTTISINGTTNINATSGHLVNGDDVFTINNGGLSLGNGQTLTINGTASQSVVLNFDYGNNNIAFGGNILLTGGITANQVLFNIIGGNGATLSGGGQYGTAADYELQYGTFLDPDGKIVINAVNLYGHVYGGDSQDMQITSGADIIAVPEPAPVALMAVSLCLLSILRLRARSI
jgi:hypothetical protein